MSIVVPTWQRPTWLERCLRALQVQECVPDEVLVVGRGQDKAAKEIVQRGLDWSPLNVRWVEVDALGHVAPWSRGLEEVAYELVAVLDDDTEPDPSWLTFLLVPFTDPDVSTVGGRVTVPRTGAKIKVSEDAGRIRWYGQCPGNVGARRDAEPIEVDSVMEGNSAWRCAILRDLEFDPVLDFDDAPMFGFDLCLQAKSRGHRIMYQSKAVVLHHSAPREPILDREALPRRTIAFSRNYTYIALKHFRGFRRASFLVWWWLIGDRGSYGVLAAAVDLLNRRPGLRQLVQASFKGKSEGLRFWLRRRA